MFRLFVTMLIFACLGLTHAAESYQFISPKPGSSQNSRESTIIIREGTNIDPASIGADRILVSGSKSGEIQGDFFLSQDGQTLIFKPFSLLFPDEQVQVSLHPGIRSLDGHELEPTQFSFHVTPFVEQPNPFAYMEDLRDLYPVTDTGLHKTASETIPGNFPPIKVEMYDSTALGEGYIFLAVASDVPGVGYYLMMLNNDGTPFFARELHHDYSYDFKMQPTGQLSYAQFLSHHSYTGGGNVIHMIMDESFNLVDSVQMGNGYIAEAHDFQILPNGHYLLFGYYLTLVDMSLYVDGGYPAAMVSGGVVQELDEDKNVIFQWRTWDHYDYADYPWNVNRSRGEYVSAFHLNTINQDIDGQIIIATPRWVKKLNRQTGEEMWHLGGPENEFSFIGVDSTDGVSYVGGHMFYRIDNGNFLLYDNGSRRSGSTSMAHEFKLDEENLTAELIWSYIPDTTIAGWHRGNAQRLPNDNTVIGWGGSSGKYSPTFTEVDASGNKLMEVFFDPYTIESYRAFRFPFTGGQAAAEVTIIEVQPGSSYEFTEGDDNDTGISVEIDTISGTGYNELTVAKYEYAPKNPGFLGKAPRTLPRRMVLSNVGLLGIEAAIEFDVAKWGITDPENTLVYHREFEGSGLFIALPTTYNHVTGKISAVADKFGEFILTYPDLPSMIFTPAASDPADSSTVNQELPVMLRWNPVGFVNYYSLQIAQDENFTNMVLDTSFMVDAVYTMPDPDDMTTYYWRVKALNNAGTSEWTDTQQFTTVEPFVSVDKPNGGEEWQVGLDYFIRWQDNLAEKVVLLLYENESLAQVIDTVSSLGAYEWEIPVDMSMGSEYLIKVMSIDNDQHFGISSAPFTIMDTVGTAIGDQAGLLHDFHLGQNYPNPFNPQTEIEFSLPVQAQVVLNIYDITGRLVNNLVNNKMSAGVHRITWSARDNAGRNLASGIYFYQLQILNASAELQYNQTRKMILIR